MTESLSQTMLRSALDLSYKGLNLQSTSQASCKRLETTQRITTALSVSFNNLQYSFIPDISKAPLQVHYYSEAFLNTVYSIDTVLELTRRSATVSEGLAQGLYVGFKPATFKTQGTENTTEPPCPTYSTLKELRRKVQIAVVVDPNSLGGQNL